MNTLFRNAPALVVTFAALACAACPQPAQAESLRCNGVSASEGDSKLSVLSKCGQPVLSDAYCTPVVYQGSLVPVPWSIAGSVVPCQPVEEWLYDRGPGNLMATVRFREGKVLSIRYGQHPR